MKGFLSPKVDSFTLLLHVSSHFRLHHQRQLSKAAELVHEVLISVHYLLAQVLYNVRMHAPVCWLC